MQYTVNYLAHRRYATLRDRNGTLCYEADTSRAGDTTDPMSLQSWAAREGHTITHHPDSDDTTHVVLIVRA